MRSSAGPERSTKWLGGVALFTIVMVPFVGYLGHQGFAPLLTLTGLLCLPGLARARPSSPPMMALFVLVAWALISLAWSPAAPHVADLREYDDLEGLTALKLLFQLAFYGSAVAALGQLSERSRTRAGTVMVVAMPRRIGARCGLNWMTVGAPVCRASCSSISARWRCFTSP